LKQEHGCLDADATEPRRGWLDCAHSTMPGLPKTSVPATPRF